MSTSQDLDAILLKISEYTTALLTVPPPDYQAALAINSAITNATKLSRDVLHLKLVATLDDIRSAAAALQAETKILKEQTDKLKSLVGKVAGVVKAVGIAVQIGLAIAAL